MICTLRTPHWNIFPFFLPFSLLLILCILWFLLPTSKASLLESHKTSVLTKNASKPLHFFKRVFPGTGDSTAPLLISHWISSDTFSIDRELGYSHGKSRHQHKLKTHGSRRQEMRLTSHYRIKWNTQICHRHNFISAMALKGSVSLALMSAVLWHCGSQEVVRTSLSSL